MNSCNSMNENKNHDMKEHDNGEHKNHVVPSQEKKYTCPMHPEIIKDEPGQCPICKMDLVEKKEEISSNKKYTCPMHPEIIQDKPGICPKCKMDLVEMKGDESKSSETELDVLLKPTNEYVISQVKTVSIKRQTAPLTIQVTGKIDYDTREIATISSKVAGRIEKLYVKYLYQAVSKGQKLMDIYSKELVTEQENFIYILQNDPNNFKLIKTAEDRLTLQGLTPDQVKKIKTEKKAIEYISVYSSYSGHLHDLLGDKSSDMSTMNKQQQKELLIREGMYVQKGQAVFNIYSTNKLWALLNVYSENQGSISKGQVVNLFVDGKELSGSFKIDFIEPEIKPNQNTVTARVYLSNVNGSIKVGSNVKGTINTNEKTGYYVPATSVVDLGSNHVVFLKENNLFRAHKVLVGSVLNDMIEIVSGIQESDLIAENAQLLMDSESFIKTKN
ncbi:MAG: efflux RND transporter periplasmic adaptor subunit [Bacteroidota bacterium]|nr:efflux RND transporter periplasmic adaptor subunit [Bacteroidota bacterium]